MRHGSGKALLAAVIVCWSGWVWHDGLNAAPADPVHATLNLGDIGKHKASHAIVLRVTAPDGAQPPILLHRASYHTYADAVWHSRNAPDAAPIATGTGFLAYTAAYARAAAIASAPTADDLQLADQEREAYTAVAAELGLSAQTAVASVERMKYFFATGYQYSPYQKNTAIVGSPMVDFLHRSKAGHCEYFATATVLLLRAGGIPARYATGFSVSEESPQRIAGESAYLVRQRHAHAWVRAYVNGAWIDIDTTPQTWITAEAQSQGMDWWVAVADRWSWWGFRASQMSLNGDKWQAIVSIASIASAGILLLLLAFWLAWRLFRRRLK